MSDRAGRAIRAGKRWFLLCSLFFTRAYEVRTARAILAKLRPVVAPEPGRPRQLLADVSVIAREDGGTGIQRVVSELLRQLLTHPPPGFNVRLVYGTRWRRYHYAEDYQAAVMGGSKGKISTTPARVRVRTGDVFLGMDLAAHILPHHHFQLGNWKASGVRFFFIVYDLLPAQRPEWFNPRSAAAYRDWIRTVSIFADGVACISQSVANEFGHWVAETYGKDVSQSVSATWFHLGGDISARDRGRSEPTETASIMERIRKRPSILMVGTIEPRKGYAQVLSAFEKLWHRGTNVNLVIVGKIGWKVGDLVQRLIRHPEAGKRLIWTRHATDEILGAMYRITDGLLMASEGEGFGLPIVEAAQHGKPLLVRDIPVFREIAGEHASYFSDDMPDELAVAIRSWLDLVQNGLAPSSRGIELLSWQQSARELALCLIGHA